MVHLAIHKGPLRLSPHAIHPVPYALDGRGRAAFNSLASGRLRRFGVACSEERGKRKVTKERHFKIENQIYTLQEHVYRCSVSILLEKNGNSD